MTFRAVSASELYFLHTPTRRYDYYGFDVIEGEVVGIDLKLAMMATRTEVNSGEWRLAGRGFGSALALRDPRRVEDSIGRGLEARGIDVLTVALICADLARLLSASQLAIVEAVRTLRLEGPVALEPTMSVISEWTEALTAELSSYPHPAFPS